MFKNIRQFLNGSAVVAIGITAAFLTTGCEGEDSTPTPIDPGQCYTTAEFRKSDVSRDYAEMICMDWVKMLLSNCVEVEGLPLLPTEGQIGAFCGRETKDDYVKALGSYPSYGDVDMYSFLIKHSCNFIDNPNYECSQYSETPAAPTETTQSTKAPKSIHTASLDPAFSDKLRAQIQATPTLRDQIKNITFYIEGNVIDLTPVSVQ